VGDESPNIAVTTLTRAVFLSYASQDAEPARKICEALRAAGVEVWFDQSELRGGDAWDQKIRREIHDCALFIPLISSNTASRHEGYFRLEWDLADQRTHMIARNRAFIVPVCLDATRDAGADVPESFQRVQWTHLLAGDTPPEFVGRIVQLLAGVSPTLARPSAALAQGRSLRYRAIWLAVVVLIAASTVYLFIQRLWIPKPAPPVASVFSPPPHSIAVLPFVNMSGDKDQEYFSEGLTEELLNSLSRINELQVAARTSSFSFQGEHPDIAAVAHKLNVGAVLEGSVRRAGNTVRITAQLVNAITGFHLWSQTYDRDLRDVLKLQTEIATAVADALKVTLLSDIAQKIELGGTQNPPAFDAYLRASKVVQTNGDEERTLLNAISGYTEAIRLDPKFALAFADRSINLTTYAARAASGAAIRDGFEKAESDARQAIALAPELAEAHLALAYVLENGHLDYARAGEEYERALALAPGNAQVLHDSGVFAARMGRFDAAIASARRAVLLDPLNTNSQGSLAQVLYFARRYEEAAKTSTETRSIHAGNWSEYVLRGFAYYGLGDLQNARTSCETTRDSWQSQWCLAVVYDKLGRHADAQAELKKYYAATGDDGAYQYATIYAQWGDHPKALQWLDTAMRLRDPGLGNLKVEPLIDPLRQEPHFRTVMHELKFPQ
jgi:TolB-like protein/Tfp pilus assembly protein PilF